MLFRVSTQSDPEMLRRPTTPLKKQTIPQYKKHFGSFPEICYIEIFNTMNPHYKQTICAVPWHIIKLKVYCI